MKQYGTFENMFENVLHNCLDCMKERVSYPWSYCQKQLLIIHLHQSSWLLFMFAYNIFACFYVNCSGISTKIACSLITKYGNCFVLESAWSHSHRQQGECSLRLWILILLLVCKSAQTELLMKGGFTGLPYNDSAHTPKWKVPDIQKISIVHRNTTIQNHSIRWKRLISRRIRILNKACVCVCMCVRVSACVCACVWSN